MHHDIHKILKFLITRPKRAKTLHFGHFWFLANLRFVHGVPTSSNQDSKAQLGELPFRTHWCKNPQLKIRRFTFSKSHFWQNSQFQSLIFDKIHFFKISFPTEFTFAKSHFTIFLFRWPWLVLIVSLRFERKLIRNLGLWHGSWLESCVL